MPRRYRRTTTVTGTDIQARENFDKRKLLFALRSVRAYELAYAELMEKRRRLGGWLEDGNNMDRIRFREAVKSASDLAISMMIPVFKVWIRCHETPEGWWEHRNKREFLEFVLAAGRFGKVNLDEPFSNAWRQGGAPVSRLKAEGFTSFWSAGEALSPNGGVIPDRLADDLFAVLLSAWSKHGGYETFKSRYPDWDKRLMRVKALLDYSEKMLVGDDTYGKIIAVHLLENAMHNDGTILKKLGIEAVELDALSDVPPAKLRGSRSSRAT